MPAQQVLLVRPNNSSPDDFPSSIERESGRHVLAEMTATISEAVSRVAKNAYDAVVCWADREDELAAVIRIRKTRPEQPIVVMTSRLEPDFGELARRAGATRTAQTGMDSVAFSDYIRLAVQSGDLRRELLANARWVHSQAREIRELAEQTSALTKDARSNYTKLRTGAFVRSWSKTTLTRPS